MLEPLEDDDADDLGIELQGLGASRDGGQGEGEVGLTLDEMWCKIGELDTFHMVCCVAMKDSR